MLRDKNMVYHCFSCRSLQGTTQNRHHGVVKVLKDSVTALGDLVQIVSCERFLRDGPKGTDTSQLRTPDFAYVFNGITHYVDVRCLDSTAPSHRGAEVMETLVAGEHAKLVDYARFRTPDGSKLVFFVLDVNGALSPQTKQFIDELQAAVKPKGHARFSKYLLRNISSALARFRAFTVGEFTIISVSFSLAILF